MNPETRTNLNTNPFESQGNIGGNPLSYLAQELERWKQVFKAQPVGVQQSCEVEARKLTEALAQSASQIRFLLPERVRISAGDRDEIPVPTDQREQLVGGLMDRLTRTGLNVGLRQRLDALENSTDAAVAIAAALIRYAVATSLVHDILPMGRSVSYGVAEGDEIPTIPNMDEPLVQSAISEQSDAVTADPEEWPDTSRGEFVVPYVPVARRFFLPLWVVLDQDDHLLVNSTVEAEAHLASMQRYIQVLHLAVALAPYVAADEVYQQKRYGMLGQLVNQGRALCRYMTREIVATIHRRAAANDLNRGLDISLPYFDDQDLVIKSHNFEVISPGRIMFVPAFVIRAVRIEQVKVEQDTRLDRSTRRHLLEELGMLMEGFTA